MLDRYTKFKSIFLSLTGIPVDLYQGISSTSGQAAGGPFTGARRSCHPPAYPSIVGIGGLVRVAAIF